MRALNGYDLLKVIALVAMTVDHVGLFLWPELVWPRVIGRVAAPLFLFLVGYNGSYGFRLPLLLAACAVTLADGVIAGVWYPQNILWTILVGRFMLQWLDRRAQPMVAVLLLCAFWTVPLIPLLDYSAIGLLWMVAGRALRRASPPWQAWTYGAVAFAGTAIYTMVFFAWPMPAYLVAILLCGAMWLGCWRMDLLAPVRAPHVLQCWSQHALAYYVLHRLVLELLARFS